MADILPRELPAAASVPTDAALIIDNGTTVEKATPEQVAASGIPVPSEAEAVAGTDNSKRMTPLRTAEVIEQRTVSFPSGETVSPLPPAVARIGGKLLVFDRVTGAPRVGDVSDILNGFPLPIESDYSAEWIDADDYSAGGFLSDGTWAPNLFKCPPGAIDDDALAASVRNRLFPAGAEIEMFAPPVESGYSYVIVDQSDFVGLGITLEGELVGAATSDVIGQSLPAIAVYADSMGAIYPMVQWVPSGEEWPRIVSRVLKRPLFDRAIAGQSAKQVLARQGGPFPLLTLDGDEIPETGPVDVTARSVAFVRNFGSDAVRQISGTLVGVHGTIHMDPSAGQGVDGPYTFVRTTDGIAMPCPPNSPFITDSAQHDQDLLQIIWVGRNGIVDLPNVPDLIADSLDYNPLGRFMIIGVCTLMDNSEGKGTTNYNTIVAYNNAMKAKYGGRFFDVRRYMIDDALADAGITPTTADLEAIEDDRIPVRFAADPDNPINPDYVHFNALAQGLIANKLVEFLTEKGI